MNTTDCEKIEDQNIKEVSYHKEYSESSFFMVENDQSAFNIPETFTIVSDKKEEITHGELKEIKSCSEANNEDSSHTLSERWSPVGADDDALTSNIDIISPAECYVLSCGFGKKDVNTSNLMEISKIKNMEEEQELLTSSLMALTSHFAHVQLRVRQIVDSPSDKRDTLLKDLEEFAFRGIPESIPSSGVTSKELPIEDKDNFESARQRQFELIANLKKQLSDLENFAYDSGAPVLPQHILLEKQKIIIDELKRKLNLKVNDTDLPQLSSDDIKNQVDTAIGEFVGPLKMKEQLVAQLKTQITDLERFIAFLQCDLDDSKLKNLDGERKSNDAYNSYAAKRKSYLSSSDSRFEDKGKLKLKANEAVSVAAAVPRDGLNSAAHGLMDKASILMQMFASTHFKSKCDHFQKNSLKKSFKGNHWGDLRAQLEVDIQEVASLAATLNFDRKKLANLKKTMRKRCQSEKNQLSIASIHKTQGQHQNDTHQNSQTSSSEDDDVLYDWEIHRRRVAHNTSNGSDSITLISKELMLAVRKKFAVTLQKLIQHGLRAETESTTNLIVPFMRCFNPAPMEFNHSSCPGSSFVVASNCEDHTDDQEEKSYFGTSGRQMHAWELILEYYYMKNGDEYNNTPARKLSQSFNLDIAGSVAISSKQSLLSAIGTIINLHRPYKRSSNSHFKAFICAGLNSHLLVEWLNLIFGCTELVEIFYTSDSYVARTGFLDSLRSIDVLSKYDFELPVDLAVRHFKNI